MKHKTRGSAADREIHCAGAIGYDGPQIDEAGDEAALGTVLGDLLERHATDGTTYDGGELDDTARAHGVDAAMLRPAYFNGLKIWEELAQHFPGPRSQVRVVGRTTRGTADLLDLYAMSDYAAIHDWKLGATPEQHVNQLKAYALAAVDAHGFPACGHVFASEGHCLSGDFFVHRFTEAQLESFRARLESQHSKAGEQFAPGRWCRYCPRAHDCDAAEIYRRATASALAEIEPGKITREQLGELWDRRGVLRQALDRYDKLVKAELDAAGPIGLADGRAIQWRETETATYSAAAVVPLLVAGGYDLDAAIKVTKAGLSCAARAGAPRGQGAKRERALVKSIEQIEGAVSCKTTRRVVCK
jgi:hypothetical protein